MTAAKNNNLDHRNLTAPKRNRNLTLPVSSLIMALVMCSFSSVQAEEILQGSASVTDSKPVSEADMPPPALAPQRTMPTQSWQQQAPEQMDQNTQVFQMQAQQYQQPAQQYQQQAYRQQAFQGQSYQQVAPEQFALQSAYAAQQHGQFKMGTVGFHISDTGVVQKIYPGSDVLRFGIHKGDRLIGYNGHQFVSVQNVVDEAVGIPGSIMELTFMHDGRVLTIPAKRMDARMFQKYSGWGYNHITDAIKMDRSW